MYHGSNGPRKKLELESCGEVQSVYYCSKQKDDHNHGNMDNGDGNKITVLVKLRLQHIRSSDTTKNGSGRQPIILAELTADK